MAMSSAGDERIRAMLHAEHSFDNGHIFCAPSNHLEPISPISKRYVFANQIPNIACMPQVEYFSLGHCVFFHHSALIQNVISPAFINI